MIRDLHEIQGKTVSQIAAELNLSRCEVRKAKLDGFVSFDGIKYGVHWRYSGQGLRVRLHEGKIVISDIQSIGVPIYSRLMRLATAI